VALNNAATVTLCWSQKASHFWIMLLLICGAADHGWILHPPSHSGRDRPPRCSVCRLQLVREKVFGAAILQNGRKSWPHFKWIERESTRNIRKFESATQRDWLSWAVTLSAAPLFRMRGDTYHVKG
jgi:hypothetical protein